MKHWLIDKHKNNIEILNLSSKELRFNIHRSGLYEMADEGNTYNSVFKWDSIIPSYSFFYDFEGIEEALPMFFHKSLLCAQKDILVETSSELPILRMTTSYFSDNCMDFIDANHGMGSIAITGNEKLLLEFTDDCKHMLFSNFKIKT